MKEKSILGGAVLAGFLASLCCIGPLLFVALGVSAFGAAGVFESARPYLMGGAVLMLAVAFYLIYFKRSEAACGPDGTCTARSPSRANRLGLWIASLAVLAFALTPYLAAPIAARISDKKAVTEPVQKEDCCAAQKPSATAATSDSTSPAPGMKKTIFTVEGMTCSGCELPVKMALERTPGVSHAQVSYDKSEAVIEYDPNKISLDKLRETINKTGYSAKEGK
jgi:copper chaperone CopZ